MAQAPLNLAPPPLPAAQPAIAAAVSEPAVVASPPEPAETEVAAAPPEPEPEPPPPPEPVAQPEPEPEPAQPIASVAEPEPLPAVEPEPLPEEEAQVASVEPSGAIDLTEEGQVLSLAFEAGESDLDGATVNALSALVTEMRRDEGARVQLIAYAGVNGGSASSARRLSLSRALAVRGYLIENGVRSTRIDVRALGDNVDDGSPERVDVFVLPR
jgi:outer membrane protein OmpA-like peptidoglycan-associated protein